MADEALVEYTLVVTDPGNETVKDSHDFTGTGKATYPNGDSYEGPFVNGVRAGKSGKYTYAQPKAGEDGIPVESDVYEGPWENNLKHGIGKQTYVGQGTYHGYWEAGEKSGEGVMSYVNGDIYSGNWQNGKKHGKGTYIFNASGMKFIG